MTDKKCPQCGLWNTGSALQCDCGYDFETGRSMGMNDAQAQMLSSGQRRVPRFLFWSIAMIPALSLILVRFVPKLSQLVIGSSSRSVEEISLWEFLLPPILIPLLVAFVINLVSPVVADTNGAFRFAMPVFIAHLYFYSIQPFFDPGIVNPNDFWEDFGFEMIWTITVSFPVAILLFVCTALFSRFGSHIRKVA